MSCDFRLIDYNYVFQSETDIFVSSENPDFPKTNLRNYSRSKMFRTTATAAQWVVFDIDSIEEIDSFAMIFNPLEEIKLSPLAVVKLQANATNSWGSPAVDVTLSISDREDLISHFFSTDQVYRYWRVYIDDPSNTWGYIEIPKIILGKKILLNRSPEIGFEMTEKDLSVVEKTPYGHKYFDVYPTVRSLSFDFNMMDYEDIKLISDSFNFAGTVSPVLCVMNADASLFDKDFFSIYGTYMGSLKLAHVVKQYFKVPVEIEEFI